MKMEGAIFDCDGTLLDSVPMWKGIFARVVEAFGNTLSPERACELFEATEHLPLREQCCVVQEMIPDLWPQTQDPFDDLLSVLPSAYEQDTQPFEGAREFLESLAAAGVSMVVASSTTKNEVRQALAHHGLLDYFTEVISTEDVGGRDKEFPDVYLKALEILGTKKEATWVFEDAAFGIASSSAAGFPVVALAHQSNGRDETKLCEHADILVHSFEELSFEYLSDYEKSSDVLYSSAPFTALILAGGDPPHSVEFVRKLALEADFRVAADKGLDCYFEAAVVPQLFCGDADSVSEKSLSWSRNEGVKELVFPSEKYASDLALAIDAVRHEATRRNAPCTLCVSAASGGRADYAFAVVGLLARAYDLAPRIVEEDYELRILSASAIKCWELGPKALGKTFSLIPLSDSASVSLRGMKWNLEHFSLTQFSDRGISNYPVEESASVECHEGLIACYLLQ